MANSGLNTNGSQFFVVYKASPSLNGTSLAEVYAFDSMHCKLLGGAYAMLLDLRHCKIQPDAIAHAKAHDGACNGNGNA